MAVPVSTRIKLTGVCPPARGAVIAELALGLIYAWKKGALEWE